MLFGRDGGQTYVSSAVADEEHRIGDDFLGVACRIRDLQRQYHDKGRIIRPRQEIADVAADALVEGHEA